MVRLRTHNVQYTTCRSVNYLMVRARCTAACMANGVFFLEARTILFSTICLSVCACVCVRACVRAFMCVCFWVSNTCALSLLTKKSFGCTLNTISNDYSIWITLKQQIGQRHTMPGLDALYSKFYGQSKYRRTKFVAFRLVPKCVGLRIDWFFFYSFFSFDTAATSTCAIYYIHPVWKSQHQTLSLPLFLSPFLPLIHAFYYFLCLSFSFMHCRPPSLSLLNLVKCRAGFFSSFNIFFSVKFHQMN